MPLLGGAIAWGLWCSKSSHERLYLLLPVIGLLCVVVLGQTLIVFEQQPIGVLPRYQALYYTPTIAALSLLATRSRSISVFLLLLSAWAILHHHFWFSPETSSQHRGYDGVALYYFGNGEEVPPNRGIAFAEESEDFLRGYSVVQRLQYRSYWHFWWPAQQPRLPISQVVTAHRFFHLSQIEDSNDFSRGVQSAVRLWTSKGQSRD